jgi:hypothetical protein
MVSHRRIQIFPKGGGGGEGGMDFEKKIGVIFNIAKNNNIVFPILGSKRWGMGFPRHPSEFVPSLKHLLVLKPTLYACFGFILLAVLCKVCFYC